MSDTSLAIRLFLQLALILLVCRLVGWIGKRFLGQTLVVMEMLAGVLLGPSLLGLFWPSAQEWLFPQTLALASGETIRHPSMQILYAVSQVGIVLYMFIVGLELNVEMLHSKAKGAALVSVLGVLAPFILGAGLAIFLHTSGGYYGSGMSSTNAAIYTGAAMSITAFPLLARILYEKGILRTPIGSLALGAGAINDAIAWCLLAFVLALIKGTPAIALLAVGGAGLYTLSMLTIGKSLLVRVGAWFERDESARSTIFACSMALLMVGAWFTDSVGIHAVFGAFIVGVSFPRGQLAEELRSKVQPITVGLLLPTFFVFSGLNTSIGLISSGSLWLIAGLIVFLAVVGKGVACTLAARVCGEPWRDSLAIGALMNARGLMELIILNIGLQQGVITPTFFTMMVIMAIVTTLMASPLFELAYRNSASERPTGQPAPIPAGG